MLSLVNATIPAAQNTISPSTMIALRVRPKTRRDLITWRAYRSGRAGRSPSARIAQQQLVAEEDCAVGHHRLARGEPIQDLHPIVLPDAGGLGPLEIMPVVAGHPHRHRAVALPGNTFRRHR